MTGVSPFRLGSRRDPETIKRDGWIEQGILVVSPDDDRLAWPEREFLRQIGKRLYGERKSNLQPMRRTG